MAYFPPAAESLYFTTFSVKLGRVGYQKNIEGESG